MESGAQGTAFAVLGFMDRDLKTISPLYKPKVSDFKSLTR